MMRVGKAIVRQERGIMGEKERNLGGERGNVIRCGVLKLWGKDEKCVRRHDSGEDLSCLVLKQRRKVLVD
jgi:hypothetical protein